MPASLAERRQTFCSQFKLRHVGILRKSPELSEMALDSKKNRIQKKIVRCLKTSDQRRKIEGGGLEGKRTSLWLVNQISKELKTPGLFHARIIAPVCNPVRPSSTPVHPSVPSLPLPQKGRRPKRELFVLSPDLGIFSSFFTLSFSLSLGPLPRYRVPDKKMAGSLESFLKNARTFVHIVRTHRRSRHTHEPSFHSWLGKVFQKTLKMHDIRLVRKRGSTRIDNRVHNSQTLGYRWLGYTCTTRERWEFLGGGGGCTGVSR